MDNAYQFSHIMVYYDYQKRLAYAYNRIELGDIYDNYATIYWSQSLEEKIK